MTEPTQIDREQAPARKHLSDIRAAKLAEARAEIAALFPGRTRQTAAQRLLTYIVEGRIPGVTFNG